MEQLNQIIDPTTGMPLGEALWQQVALSLSGIASIIISVVGGYLALLAKTYLPAWVNAFIDQKRKDDVHQAAVTIARRIILEGGDPRQNLQLGIEYMTESAKDAYARWQSNGRSAKEVREIFGNIFISKIPGVVTELGMGINVPQPGYGQHGEMVAEPSPEAEDSYPPNELHQAKVPVSDAVPHAR